MKFPMQRPRPGQGRTSAFTLMEVAICVLVIAVGLVAVLGVLPVGLMSQKKTKEEALIQMEGMYFLEAIRNGANRFPGNRVVDAISSNNFTAPDLQWTPVADRDFIVGHLSAPHRVTRAKVRLLTGSAATQDPDFDPVTTSDPTLLSSVMSYLLTTEIVPFNSFWVETNALMPGYDPDADQRGKQIRTNLWEIRVRIDWPLYAVPRVVNGQTQYAGPFTKVFRTYTSGRLTPYKDGRDQDYWLFEPQSYIRHEDAP